MLDFHRTIVEIYDEEPIFNVQAAAQFKPDTVVFLGTRRLKNKRVKENILNTFSKLSLSPKCFFCTADMHDLASVTAELKSIAEKHPDCAVDITGGNEVALVASGMIAAELSIPLFKYDVHAKVYRNIYGCPAAEGVEAGQEFSIDAMLAMTGAMMKSHGHLSLDELPRETEDDIFRLFSIYKAHHRAWHKSVSYLQQVSKHLEGSALHVDAAAVVYGSEKISGADRVLMEKLADAGMIKNYKNDGRRISFDYKDTLIRSCLCDAGICLELYVFAAAKRMGIFNDVRISVVIDWDGDLAARVNTINEIDVMMMRGTVPLFVSCKSGTPNVTALNEIKTLADKFGGKFARPVLVTMSDVKAKDKYLALRAEDMGVSLIDRSDLVLEKLPKLLYGISEI